jgi:hypothetical protein
MLDGCLVKLNHRLVDLSHQIKLGEGDIIEVQNLLKKVDDVRNDMKLLALFTPEYMKPDFPKMKEIMDRMIFQLEEMLGKLQVIMMRDEEIEGTLKPVYQDLESLTRNLKQELTPEMLSLLQRGLGQKAI